MNTFIPRKTTGYLTLAALVLTCLTACDTKNNETQTVPTSPSKSPSLADLKNPAVMEKTMEASLPKGDRATPLGNYRTIDSGNQIMFLYYGLLNLPIDYEKIAKVFSAEYDQTSDSFKKKDILTALQPRIDQEIAKAKNARYVMLNSAGSDLLSRYDFSKKSFAIPSLADNSGYNYFYNNSRYSVTRTNSTAFASFTVPDEAKARIIEDYLSKNTNLKLEVYSYAQDADPSNQRVKLEVLKVRLLSPTGEVLVEQ